MSDRPCQYCSDAAGWVLGALSPQEAERFAGHLKTCASCRAEVAKLTEASERLAEPVALLTPPPELRERVMASVHAEASLFNAARADTVPEPVRHLRRSRRRAGALVATVATLATVIAAIVLLAAHHASHQAAARTVAGTVTPKDVMSREAWPRR